MEKKLTLILGVVLAVLALQILILSVVRQNLPPVNQTPGAVSAMSREERLNLLETLWQSADFKNSTPELRRKAFESIVVK